MGNAELNPIILQKASFWWGPGIVFKNILIAHWLGVNDFVQK